MEEFLSLHYIPSHTNKNDLKRNIFWLEYALKSPIKPADRIDVPTVTYREYEKYKLLTRFYVNFLICLNYLRLAGFYNKFDINWHDTYYSKDILASYKISEFYYGELAEKWKQVKYYQGLLDDYKDIELDGIEYIEEILYKVRQRTIDYNYISKREINNINIHRGQLNALMKNIRANEKPKETQ